MTFDFQSKRSPNYQKPSHIPGKRSKAFAEHIASIPEQKRSSLQQRMLIRHNNGECIGCTHQGVPLGVNGMELPVVRVMRGFFAPPEFCDCELGVRYSQRIERQREEFIHRDKLERYTYACRLLEKALLPSLPEEHTFENWPVEFITPLFFGRDDYLSLVTERKTVKDMAQVFIETIDEVDPPHKGIGIQGYPGVGKTSLILSMRTALQQTGHYMLALNTPILLSLIQHSEQEEQMLYTLQHTPLLFLDNLGDAQSMDPAPYSIRRILLDVFDARYNARLTTLVTTELDNEQLRCQFGDAIFSRINGLCCFYELPGIDLR
ncbi:hypothetical protein KSD_90700 [Ktedonobacter sp. SOSP1-85]|uniref:ATP-binding protein n=1 Tax=Ktedonobacter sp. SOSP1-85 TaxID=2778367 RepID=UPI001914E669|nr:ATP-binding protein [Ktedonobacter sp. SOSP1-85]GHO81299.1 hypothetical protein KSD_90700 [Ktedonobacter sp. SOSP1-85]